MDGGASQLPVRQRQAEVARGKHHVAQVIRTDLVPEAARSTVDANDELIRLEAVSGCDRYIEDFRDALNLQIVVLGSKGSHLAPLAFPGAL